MSKQKQDKTSHVWYVAAVAAVLLAAPHGALIKTLTEDVSPVWFNALRFAAIVLITAPFIYKMRRKINRKNLQYSLLFGLFYAFSVLSYTTAIQLSQASYVAVIDLSIPVLLMLYSVYLTKERVSRKAMVGISVAALGAFTIVGFPLLAGQGFASDFHPLATALALVNCFSFPLTIIFSRKANEEGLPLFATFGIAAMVVALLSGFIAVVASQPFPTAAIAADTTIVLKILYSAIAVSLISRLLTVAAFRRIGSATIGGLHYIESFLAILVPIALLGERMTSEMLLGGLLILVGVLIIETKHHPALRAQQGHGHRHS